MKQTKKLLKEHGYWAMLLSLQLMKKKFAIINLSLMLTVLFAILFQTSHSYEHFLGKELSVHPLDNHTQDLHQNDHNHQQCFVCEFTFNNFIGVEITSFTFKTSFEGIAYHFFYTEKPSFFSGSHPYLRGPPQVA